MKRVVTFGELMLRLQPYNYERFVQCDHVEFTFGGGEANVAVSLANYGMDAAYVTKLPAHAIGQAAVNSLRRYGVDTTKIVRGGDRVGIYFNEKGASQRGSVCIYDRANSAIAKASREDFDWDDEDEDEGVEEELEEITSPLGTAMMPKFPHEVGAAPKKRKIVYSVAKEEPAEAEATDQSEA